MGGNAYRYNKKSQMTIKPTNLLEINQMKMFNHSHSINNDSFGMSQGNDQSNIHAEINNRVETD